MGSFLAALLALCGVIIAGYLSNFVAEDYKRFRDGSSLAAALSGELRSYQEGAEMLGPMLSNLIAAIMKLPADQRLPVPKFDIPPDPVFDSSVKQLGLLGPELAGDVAYVYQQLRAFRQGFSLYTTNNAEWTNERAAGQLDMCQVTNGRAMLRGIPLIKALIARANEQYEMPHLGTLLKWRGARSRSPNAEDRE